MRNKILFSALVCLAVAGCTSTNSSSEKSSGEKSSGSGEGSVPTAVKAAFDSEHFYAKMDHPTTRSSSDGGTIYEIPYTNADGTKGIATYGPTGELLKNE